MEEANKERKASEISIQQDQELTLTYGVTIDNKFFLNVTVSDFTNTEDKLREWIREVQAIYGKNKRRSLIVGLSATCNQSYAKNCAGSKDKRWTNSYGLLQLCVGSHCLLMQVGSHSPFPRVMKDFLYDSRTVVVGVGIEEIAKKLEKEKEKDGLIIRKRVELRKEAATKFFPGNNFENCSIGELAEVVLGGEVVYVKPKKIQWWDDENHGYGFRKLSQQMIKYASVEAFLACKMGSDLLKDLN